MAVPTVALLDAHAESLGDKRATALLRLPRIAVINLDAEAAGAAAAEVPLAKGDLSRSHAGVGGKKARGVLLDDEPA